MAFEPRWIAWKQGRNFRAYHWQDTPRTTLCGVQIPAIPEKCYALNVPPEFLREACAKCAKLRLMELIP